LSERPDQATGLARTIGPLGLGASVINVTIGSSIFVFPATVAGDLGAAGILAYLIAAFAMGLIALCFAESGTRVPATGGTYAYVETAFGPFAAWVIGLLMYVGVQLIASAVVASVFVRSLSALVPGIGSGLPRALLIVAMYVAFATINVRGGARLGARVVEGVTIAKLAPLVLLVVVGLTAFRPEFVRWDGLPPAADLGRIAMRLLYLFAGMEAVLAVSGELRDPSRTIPRGALGGLAVATAIYLGVQFAAQGLLGPALPTHDRAPLADAAAVVLGPTGRNLLLLGTVISTVGFLSADLLASPRTLFAMAAAGRLPRPLAAVNRRFGSPAVAIVVHAALAAMLAIQADFDTLTALASSALLLIYFVSALGLIVLQRRKVGEEKLAFRLPAGPLIPVAATALVVALMTTLAWREILAVLVVVALAAITYIASKVRRDSSQTESSAIRSQ
jgi:APA family basic amino acid/polyamine antiporter